MTLGANGLDVSFARISRAWADRRAAEGVRIFVQNLFTGGYQNNAGIKAVAEANLCDARGAGLITAGYLNTNPWWGARQSLNTARVNAGAEWPGLAAVLNDVEIAGVTEAHVKEQCEAIVGAGKLTAIYSARWYWAGHLGDAQWPWLKAYRIWAADYDGDPRIAATTLYGPWSMADVMGKQYAGTMNIEGVDADLNTFDLSFFEEQAHKSESEEDGMTDQEAIQLIAGLKDGEFVGDGFIVWQVSRPARADYPVLRRIDNSNAGIIAGPVKAIPLLIAAYLLKGPDI